MPVISVELVLIAVRAIALVGALLVFAIAFRHWRRSATNDAQRMFEQLDLIRAELMLLAERVDRIETVAPRVIERPVVTETRAPVVTSSAAPRGYEVAARLAKGGATCDELISSCGLSRHEAELLLRLHKGEAATGKPQTRNDSAQLKASQIKASEDRRARLSVVG